MINLRHQKLSTFEARVYSSSDRNSNDVFCEGDKKLWRRTGSSPKGRTPEKTAKFKLSAHLQ